MEFSGQGWLWGWSGDWGKRAYFEDEDAAQEPEYHD